MTTDANAEQTDQLAVRRTIAASPQTVFGVLADPAQHAAIDGTGWVRDPRSSGPITAVGDVFEMDMFHPNVGGDYVMRNEVVAFDPPSAIAWLPIGQGPDGQWAPGGWQWRYDLAPSGDGTQVTLTYDWSDVPQFLRDNIPFPPFPVSHLENSLANLDALATGSKR
ncbi:polyketide cyclase [Epidermidibacterium keratini]|uniref:Polyketide cyclase n=1 Tax=Epidermidibacterium keratini TaxID=1891644 RepID=A0A7L4YIH3_9ACTN|nr:SRPBCC family protein [Epidermidibacterium keratini]QHB98997.1 polyketide cyclase [Epidermidibacterium keratini]